MNESVTEPQRRLNPFGPANDTNAFFKQALSDGPPLSPSIPHASFNVNQPSVPCVLCD
jgi:hypothetical protein